MDLLLDAIIGLAIGGTGRDTPKDWLMAVVTLVVGAGAGVALASVVFDSPAWFAATLVAPGALTALIGWAAQRPGPRCAGAAFGTSLLAACIAVPLGLLDLIFFF